MKLSIANGSLFETRSPLDHLADNSKLLETGLQKGEELSPCRIWTGPKVKSSHKDYGRLSLYRNWPEMKKATISRGLVDRVQLRTHRISLMMRDLLQKYHDFNWSEQKWKDVFFKHNEKVKELGLEADHLCAETLCFEPCHLEWVTREVNLERMWTRVRQERREAEFGRLHNHMHGQFHSYAQMTAGRPKSSSCSLEIADLPYDTLNLQLKLLFQDQSLD